MSAVKRNDVILGIVLLVFSAILYFNTNELPKDVKMFPHLIFLTIVVNAFVMIFKRQKSSSEEIMEDKKVNYYQNIVIIILMLFVYYFLLSALGFYTSSFIFAFTTYLFLNKKVKKSILVKGIGFSLLFTIAIFVVFNKLLHLITPTGLLV